MRIHLIACVDSNNGIGKQNKLLVQLPEDMARFKGLTMGKAVIMGRKTWESIPEKYRPLPGRYNIVLSRSMIVHMPYLKIVDSFEDALQEADGCEDVYVIGGQQVYEEALPLANQLDITRLVNASYDADAFFPEIDPEVWRLVDSKRVHNKEKDIVMAFETYTRIVRCSECGGPKYD